MTDRLSFGRSIPLINIPGTSIEISRFIFGTASLFNAGGKELREKLIRSAVEVGFKHFDTAPYYGFGVAERELSSVLRDYPNVGVTTKVGIYSPGGEFQRSYQVLARKALGRVIKPLSRPEIDFSLERAKESLVGSLSRLGRDYIEIFMLHEPNIELIRTDEWQRWLEDEKRGGRIGAYGLALEAHLAKSFLSDAPELTPVIQVLDSLDIKEADVLTDHGRPLQITYGYVSAAKSRGDTRPTRDILTAALRRNADGAIIVSTRKPERLLQYAEFLDIKT